MTLEQLRASLQLKEGESFECKEAKQTFSLEKLLEYSVALANEKGGKLVLGVTNAFPRRVVGTAAFPNLVAIKQQVLASVGIRVHIDELEHEDGRVLVFDVPPRPIGMPLHYKGRFLMRSGESLVSMSPDQLKRINDEVRGPDFSSELCPDSTLLDLDPEAIEVFRQRWHKKSGRADILSLPVEQLMEDSELSRDGQLTYAGLILLGTHKSLGRFLAQAEVVLEYRGTEDQIEASQRYEFRAGFLTFHDDLWNQINARNDVVSIRDGLFRREIPAFNEEAVREAILNAICHRDYRLGGSVFIRQYPRRLEISSPGGLPEGITPDNILRKQSPRNRRLAEACAKCGLVERSGQGMDRIFDSSLREAKGLPDFTGTDEHEVVLSLRGEVIDPKFLQLLELAERHNIDLNVHHLVVLEAVRNRVSLLPEADRHVDHLLKIGLLEEVGKGKGKKLILSRGMYSYLGEPGSYTRYVGLDRETNKSLILKHIEGQGPEGASLAEFRQVLPSLTDPQIRHLVYELRDEGKIALFGWSARARWVLAEEADWS